MYQFLSRCDLDFVSRIILSGAYLLYYLGRNLKFSVWLHLGMAVSCTSFWVTVTLTLFLE